jgi:hypothetical protein
MYRVLILTFLLWPLSSYAADDPSSHWRLLQISQPVFGSQNPDGTWNGSVQVSAAPCPQQPRIITGFGFSNVRNKEEAFTQIAQKLDAVEKSAEELESDCKK